MIRTSHRALLVVALIAALGLSAAAEGESVRYVTGIRTWYPSWEAGSVDLGEGHLDSLYVNVLYGRLSAGLLLGIGGGWSVPVEIPVTESETVSVEVPVDQRVDALASVAFAVLSADQGSLYLGGAYHYFGYDSSGGEVDYYGPAIMTSLYLTLFAGENAAADLRVSGYYYPYLLFSADSAFAKIENLDTTGYQVEAAGELTYRGVWQLQVGWRHIIIEDGLSSSDRTALGVAGDAITSEDRIGGPFAQVSVVW